MINDKPFSYLEFGSIDPATGKRFIYDYKDHDKAYEWLMHARYSNDIYAYQKMLKELAHADFTRIVNIYQNDIHHRDDFVVNNNKLLALEIAGHSFFELGQTLFGCIDAMSFIQEFNYKHLGIKSPCILGNVLWQGVDISDFFNLTALQLHNNYHVSAVSDLNTIQPEHDVFFAKGITLLYAVRSADDLLNLTRRKKISIFDYSFSLSDDFSTQIGTGKNVKYLSKHEFLSFYEMVKMEGKDIWVRNNFGVRGNGKLFYFEGFICCAELSEKYIKRQTDWIHAFSRQSEEFLMFAHRIDDEYWSWTRLDSVLDKI
ncbi:hypothetical protein [Aeromonas veronii]|uniref:hypothetical protein n=1 Tax=Aeromonas veronii TaxID=654 RepID=UPI00226C9AB0|nr:hypothetical protein [Aeromonas veronii]MCX9103492.1 hypothetical protein [Aeromonas veronii]MCX9119143.1 hypothetical protein [Aeromonas veronii]